MPHLHGRVRELRFDGPTVACEGSATNESGGTGLSFELSGIAKIALDGTIECDDVPRPGFGIPPHSEASRGAGERRLKGLNDGGQSTDLVSAGRENR